MVKSAPIILAIESSCDDTSVAITRDSQVLSNVISSQQIHNQWGGVIPELASRAHLENMPHVVAAALSEASIGMDEIDCFACTTHPGLLGALLVGSSYAKGLALRFAKPCVPVNHIEGHLYSGFLEDPDLKFPFIALVVSGGHTSLFFVTSFRHFEVIGSTRDDAAGEAFDKAAKLLGLGYPGGAIIDRLADLSRRNGVQFPRALMNSSDYEFSFSGIKTSVRNYLSEHHPDGFDEKTLAMLCATVQEAIVDVLVTKTLRAVREYAVHAVCVAGGVSANSRLRAKLAEEAAKSDVKVVAPRISYSLDNAAMIGFVAAQKVKEAGLDAFRALNFEVNSKALRIHRHGSRAES